MEEQSNDIKLEITYYYKILEPLPGKESKRMAKKKVNFHFPSEKPCHEIHKELCKYTGDRAVLFTEEGCVIGGTVEKSLAGRNLFLYNKETAEFLLKETYDPQQKYREVTIEDVKDLCDRYYST